jgi:transcriptional regulator of arginine metabolism
MKSKNQNQNQTTMEVLRNLLKEKGAHDQEELKRELKLRGHQVNQSTISRHLKKLGAIKILNIKSSSTQYKLPEEEAPPHINTTLHDLILKIEHNDSLIVIHTVPGAASLIARSLDHFGTEKILGTIAGDDTIFVACSAKMNLKNFTQEIFQFFKG